MNCKQLKTTKNGLKSLIISRLDHLTLIPFSSPVELEALLAMYFLDPPIRIQIESLELEGAVDRSRRR